MIPAVVPLKVWRNADFSEEYSFADDSGEVVQLVGYAARAQVRLYGAQPGNPKIDLPGVTTPIEGARIVAPGTAVAAVQLRIDKETLLGAHAALSGNVEPGAVMTLAWDLIMTLPDGSDEVWMEGSFIMQPGVTVDG